MAISVVLRLTIAAIHSYHDVLIDGAAIQGMVIMGGRKTLRLRRLSHKNLDKSWIRECIYRQCNHHNVWR